MKKRIMKKVLAMVIAGVMITGSSFVPVFGNSDETQTESSVILEDGIYQIEVTMEGGSGRASIQSPAKLTISDGTATAEIIWSSSNYDYMIVDGEKYDMVNTQGNSTFEIPVTVFDEKVPVIGDTVAMSEPHEIEYTFYYDLASITEYVESDNSESVENHFENDSEAEELLSTDDSTLSDIEPTEIEGLTRVGFMELKYATQFAVEYYEEDYKLLTVRDTCRFLLVPEGKEVPEALPDDIGVLQAPMENIYLVATSAMDYFDKIDALSGIRLSGTNADGWYIENAKQAMENGDIIFAGKYSAPDYESIISQGCSLAIESTMIYHTPDVKEKLEKLGIPVMIERSSYESHPLGRMEWIKFYGALMDKEENALKFYQEQLDLFEQISQSETTDQTVAFFYINTAGTMNVRKSGDYVPKMIELAGGRYVFDQLSDDGDSLSSMNITVEDFYVGAKDADYLIYNSTIDGEMGSLKELISKNELLAGFKAVQNGNVWCTQKSLFQESTGLAVMMRDIHEILTNKDVADQLTYMYRLK